MAISSIKHSSIEYPKDMVCVTHSFQILQDGRFCQEIATARWASQ